MNRAHQAREMIKNNVHPKCVSGLLGDGHSAITHKSQCKYNKRLRKIANSLASRDIVLADHCCLCGYQNVYCVCVCSEDEFVPQSGDIGEANVQMMNCISKEQNVSFAGKEDCYSYNVSPAVDPTRSSQDTGDVSLGEFFKRPVKIFEQQWAVGAALYANFDPWSLFIQNRRVVNRMTNYNMFRGNLHVKFIINGNGFHYGRILSSYLPMRDFDDLTQQRSTVPAEMVQESQQPHVFLNPTQSTGGEMILPFFWHKNYASLPDGEYSQLGQLTLRSFSTLKHANGADDPVTISCFAWFDDIELTQLTSRDAFGMGPQSGEIDEANTKGMISTPATTVAKIAGNLKAIPEIAPFAMATQGAATAVASAARAMGYSRPSVTKDPEPFKPLSTSDLAPTTVPDGSKKLTVDDKQELTIDPSISGIAASDTMNIKSIASRESYLTQFTWPQTAVPEGFLFNMRIDPCMFAENPGVNTEYFLTASAAAAVPFKYWTGSMKIRFQFVASAYHKGRLKIVYDPNYIENSESTYNTNYVHVVDLAEKQDFTVNIGPAQTTSLMTHNRPGIDRAVDLYSNFLQYTTTGFGNGILGVYCVNELTTPNSLVNNDIQVNVFVSMGDDFEVFVPDDHFQSLVWDRLEPQSGEIFSPQSGDVADPTEHTVGEEDKPLQSESETLGMGTLETKHLNAVFTGEAITSFRQMLKRFNLHTCLVAYNGSAGGITAIGRNPAFPYLRGYVENAVDSTALGDNYNYCNTVMLHWVTLMFQGYRGSIRWKIIPRGKLTVNAPMLQVQRALLDNEAGSNYRAGFAVWDIVGQTQSRFLTVVDDSTEPGFPISGKTFSGGKGAMIYNGYINPVAEFEVPYYNRERFTPGKHQGFSEVTVSNSFDYNITCTSDQKVAYESWCAAGEDFQTYFFTGLPGLFYEPAPPAY